LRISVRICARSFASRFESGSSIRYKSDTLALAARQLRGTAAEHVLDVEVPRRGLELALDLAAGLLACPHAERDVRGDGHVRVQRVLLEHHRDTALPRRRPRDVAARHLDRPLVELLEARDRPQQRRLPRAGGTYDDEELAVGRDEVDVLERGDRPGARTIGLRRAGDRDAHSWSASSKRLRVSASRSEIASSTV
jgi:hypothetical protein